MKGSYNWQNPIHHPSLTLGAAIVGSLVPLAVLASPDSTSPVCNALASVANNLYLVDGSGDPLTQFTSDGLAKKQATVAPGGQRVAWLEAGISDSVYVVRSASGHQISFDPHVTDRPGDLEAAGPLMGIAWSSDSVLQLQKHEGPLASRFEYHQINDQGTSAPVLGRPGSGVACAMRGEVACVQGLDVTVEGNSVFHQFPFAGGPQASATLAQGVSATPAGSPFAIEVVGFSGDAIGLQLTYPDGGQEQGYVPVGVAITAGWKTKTYGYTATPVDAKARLVRVDMYAEDTDEPAAFDPALAWLPGSHGLLTIDRRNGQAVMYLLRPNQDENDLHDHGGHLQPTSHDDQSHGDNSDHSQWSLAAQVPVDFASVVKSMRFISPSTLLLQTADGRFSEMPVEIGQGHAAALHLGQPTVLPQTLQVILDANAPPIQAQVLNWACGTPST